MVETFDFMHAKNWVSTQLQADVSISDTSILIPAAYANGNPPSLLPSIPDTPFPVIVGEGDTKEPMLCTGISSGGILNVDRTDYFGDNRKAHLTGAAVRINVVAEYFTELQEAAEALRAEANTATSFIMMTLGISPTGIYVIGSPSTYLQVSSSAPTTVTIAAGQAAIESVLFVIASSFNTGVTLPIPGVAQMVRVSIMKTRDVVLTYGPTYTGPYIPLSHDPLVPSGTHLDLAMLTISSAGVQNVGELRVFQLP